MEEEKNEIAEDKEVLTEEEKTNKKRREVVFEMALFFILGLLLGITIKTEAAKRITMGFNDYQVKNTGSMYDLNAMKKGLDDKVKAAQQAQQNNSQ